MLRRALPFTLAALTLACGEPGGNPFSTSSPSRPPSPDDAIIFVSGSWSTQLDAPREVMAVNADGSAPEQLTTCARAEQPCDVLQVAPSPDRDRLIAVRTTPTGPGYASRSTRSSRRSTCSSATPPPRPCRTPRRRSRRRPRRAGCWPSSTTRPTSTATRTSSRTRSRRSARAATRCSRGATASEVTRLVMASYLSAERGRTLDLTDPAVQQELETYVPLIQQGRGAEQLL